ncbi:hypothetical protein UA08_09481 [Talaromyces atroroseus]|uniref:AAA+ ATPase domain-containing protein n=1 Tax=Talaromyces atroroseus TaxID=1441469 RepID=A0A1Q5Q632_TALAT|nr:hypothetical protein UA08_09481 [Talaromyces atroroseus]OKL55252.1 hypothetical protein UA08_09481 [Talaromyces atroroseus]
MSFNFHARQALPHAPVTTPSPPLMVRKIEKLLSDIKRESQSPPITRHRLELLLETFQDEQPKQKKVTEIWDKDISKYKIVDSVEPETDNWRDYTFVVREHIEQKSKVSTTYVDVKAEYLRDILAEILENVRTVSIMEAKPSVSGEATRGVPKINLEQIEQNILFQFLPELEGKLEQIGKSESISPGRFEQLRLLIDHLKQAYAPTMECLGPLLQCEEITYDLLQALFKPGCHVYTKCLGSQKSRCVVFDAGEEATQKGVTFFKLECHYLDHDGYELGEVRTELGIVKFRGRRPIRTLDAFPLQYHPDRSRMTQTLVERGRKFGGLIRPHGPLIRHCKGRAFIMERGKPQAVNIDSVVAVDASLFREMEPNYHRPCVSDCWEDVSYVYGMTVKEDERRGQLEKVKENGKTVDSMTDEDFLICCPTVRCFSFTETRFLECGVGDLTDVEWSSAFDRLQIPEETREILLSATTSRLCRGRDVVFDDFIKGKGRGLNVLFFGEPGVGKTFTVEATAEHFQTPLYSVSAGELMADHGDPFHLDATLGRIFKIATRLNAILLIDEADVFMEKRSSYQTNHNRLVTIFLRKMEYYEGVLFLTTNRILEFDDAVLSRIHLKVKYSELTKDARLNIWKSFLSEAHTFQGPAIVEAGDLKCLASMKLNGREASHLTTVIIDIG